MQMEMRKAHPAQMIGLCISGVWARTNKVLRNSQFGRGSSHSFHAQQALHTGNSRRQMLALTPPAPGPQLPYSGLLPCPRVVVKNTDAGDRQPGFKS